MEVLIAGFVAIVLPIFLWVTKVDCSHPREERYDITVGANVGVEEIHTICLKCGRRIKKRIEAI